jgi:hypothetical protein
LVFEVLLSLLWRQTQTLRPPAARHTKRHTTYGMATIIPCASPREQWCLYTDSIGEVACANIVQIMSVVLYTLGIEYMCELRTCAALRA